MGPATNFLIRWLTTTLLITAVFVIHVKSKYHIVSKRQTMHTCRATECTNGHCTQMTYTGPDRPAWCRQNEGRPFKKSWKSSYSTKCDHRGICTHKTDFHQQFHDLGRPIHQQQDTYSVTCENNVCDVNVCSGQHGCTRRARMSEAELQRDIQHLPRCRESGKRKKRSFVKYLTGYCCSIGERLGKLFITIKPIGRIG